MINLLIDSHSVGYRAHHSTGSLDAGIAFGFLITILQLAERYRTNQLVFCWDGPGSLRKKLFPAYKESREVKTQEEVAERMMIRTQFNTLHEHILPKIGFSNHLQCSGYEADDLIAKVVIDNPAKFFVVVSSDHDLFQLLRFSNCKEQFQLSIGHSINASQFYVKYRIPARDWTTVKAIAGCLGDGVPGIPGVGEKTAIKYLLGELPENKKFKTIMNGTTIISRNYKLVHLPYPGIKSLTIKKDLFNETIVQQVFSDLGFVSFLSGQMRSRWCSFCTGSFDKNKPLLIQRNRIQYGQE
jgi:5'-3' exonuclease